MNIKKETSVKAVLASKPRPEESWTVGSQVPVPHEANGAIAGASTAAGA